MANLNQTIDRSLQISRNVAAVFERRVREAAQAYADRVRKAQATFIEGGAPAARFNPQQAWRDWFDYGVDYAQRVALFWDTLRERGNNWIAHEHAGKPPVLAYQYEVLADGRSFERPVNSRAGAHHPAEGVDVDDRHRPFIIIDPRAGHGPGIGGFKEDSEVGVALRPGIRSTSSSSIRIRARPDAGGCHATPKPSSSASSPSGIPTARSR